MFGLGAQWAGAARAWLRTTAQGGETSRREAAPTVRQQRSQGPQRGTERAEEGLAGVGVRHDDAQGICARRGAMGARSYRFWWRGAVSRWGSVTRWTAGAPLTAEGAPHSQRLRNMYWHGRWCRIRAPSSARTSEPSDLFAQNVTQMYHRRRRSSRVTVTAVRTRYTVDLGT